TFSKTSWTRLYTPGGSIVNVKLPPDDKTSKLTACIGGMCMGGGASPMTRMWSSRKMPELSARSGVAGAVGTNVTVSNPGLGGWSGGPHAPAPRPTTAIVDSATMRMNVTTVRTCGTRWCKENARAEIADTSIISTTLAQATYTGLAT